MRGERREKPKKGTLVERKKGQKLKSSKLEQNKVQHADNIRRIGARLNGQVKYGKNMKEYAHDEIKIRQ